ncbi:NAD(P)/FAD-dependent oxidoreductase [Saccharobesus litoralis]|uniref:NAD(P)/FAD-dependent oxidoreductase n=1 Tax=Saccharobesus litoralis TaxID=2172099 RepID=A0A2S0VVV8_9ALTE|nr:FAD-dependent oxidoreductase [Saccharobesus litoralis]AWB68313.1 NAD(P)/FAD-dependent oxidoreductase [Saccharobesus litoralis]
MLKKLVIVGNGMVTGRFLDELQSRNHEQYQVTVVSAEPHGSYNRIMLSSVLSNEASVETIIQKDQDWYSHHNVTLHLGDAVTHIDRQHKTITTAKGRTIEYDHLVIATGARSAKIPAKKLDLDNIFPFRTIADTQKMINQAKQAQKAIVVGGGFLGLEAAWGLANNGVEVTLVHRGKWLLNRQLDKTAADMLQANLESRGLSFCLGNEVDSFIGEQQVQGARLKDGQQLDCDMAIVATGITPNAEIGLQAGLQGQRAINVDSFMLTSDTSISAMGECVEFQGQTFGLVDPLWRHAKTLAQRLCQSDGDVEPFVNAPIATKLKISGINLYSAGLVAASHDNQHEVIIKDAKQNIYRKLIIESGKIKGIVLFGDVRSGAWYFDLLQQQQDVTALLPNILFGQEYASAA